MLKKIMSFLFEEVDVIEEVVEPSYDRSLSQESVQIPKMAIIDLHADVPKVEEVPLVSQKAFVFKESVVEKKGMVKPTPVKPMVTPKTYQPQGIISPIFGKKEQLSPVTKVSQTPLPLHAENESIIGTVFSPIYGTVAAQSKSRKNRNIANKNVSMEEMFSNESDVQSPFEQPRLESLFETDHQRRTHNSHEPQSDVPADSSDRLIFHSLFDEQE